MKIFMVKEIENRWINFKIFTEIIGNVPEYPPKYFEGDGEGVSGEQGRN